MTQPPAPRLLVKLHAPPLALPMLVSVSCGSTRSPLNAEPRPARSQTYHDNLATAALRLIADT
jgi:hypothetical protein